MVEKYCKKINPKTNIPTKNTQKALSENTDCGFSTFISSNTLAFLGCKTFTNSTVAKIQVIPSTQNNPL